jgi:hypothetical protein
MKLPSPVVRVAMYGTMQIANTSTSNSNDSKTDSADDKKDNAGDKKDDKSDKNDKPEGPNPQSTPIQGKPSSQRPATNRP